MPSHGQPSADAFLRAHMPALHLLVCLLVIRLTYGDRGRSRAELSIGGLVKATGRSRSGCKEALDDLLKEGVLFEIRPPSCRHERRLLALNTDYERWGR